AASFATRLARLSLLSLLSLLTLLSAAQLPLLPASHLLHAALQFLGFAAQHLLLPPLLRGGLLFLLLLGQFLLALGKLLELLQRFVDFLLPLVGGGSLLSALVLVLLGIEFQVEETLEVALGPAASPATASALAAESHLDFAESRLGTQE